MGYLTNMEAWAVYYTVIKQDRHLRTRGKCRKDEPQASVSYISRVFSNVRSGFIYIITHVILAFWLVIANDLLEGRCTIDFNTTKVFLLCFKMAAGFEKLDKLLHYWEKDKYKNVSSTHWTGTRSIESSRKKKDKSVSLFKSKALRAAHGWIADFWLCGKTSLCAKLFVRNCTSPVPSFSWKSIHFHVKCFAWAFVLERDQGKKQLRSGSKVCIWAKWPFRLAVIPVSVA